MRPLRHPRVALLPRELSVLHAVMALHREFGDDTQFTADAVGYIFGSPVAGSLAALAMGGYVAQRSGPFGVEYSVLPRGRRKARQSTREGQR